MAERIIWLVPLAVAVLGAWRPRAGLVTLAAALPLFGSPPGGPYLAALDAAGIAAIVTAWRGGRALPSALSWPVAAFVAVSLATLVPALYLPPSWQPTVVAGLLQALPGVESWTVLYTWRAAADLLLGWGLFWAVRRAFSGHSLLPLCWGLLAGLAATLVAGLAAHVDLVNLDGWRPQRSLRSPSSRIESFFFLSGWLSQYLVFVAPVAIVALRSVGRAGRILGPLVLALTMSCLALTQQRGAWLAVAVQLAFWVAVAVRRGWWKRLAPRRIAPAAAVTVALAVAVLAGSGGLTAPLERLRTAGFGLGDRGTIWSGAAGLIGDRPLMGWGLGAFTPAFDLSHPPGSEGASWYRLTAHNLYLHVVAERGLLGLAALALLGWAAVVCLRRPRAGHEAMALALAVGLVGTAVYGLVQYVYYLRNIAWLLWLLTGCVALVSRCEAANPLRQASRFLVLVALLALPVRALMVDSPALAGNRCYGFHEVEGRTTGRPFRWVEGRAACRIPWSGETLILGLANGHPRAGERPVTVGIGIDGEHRRTVTVPGGWQEHRIDLGPPRRDWLLLTVAADPPFRPFSDFRRYPDLPRSADIRSLAVAVAEVRWE